MTGIGEALLVSTAAAAVSAGFTYLVSDTQKFEGARQKDLLTAKSSYGAAIPWCWGTVRDLSLMTVQHLSRVGVVKYLDKINCIFCTKVFENIFDSIY